MNNMLSPGIYLQEADFSEYAQSASTSIVGCVGEAKRGPIGVPTLVTSQKELIDIFGEPTEGEYGIYSALQALTQTTALYYVRAVRTATSAKAGTKGVDKVLYTTKVTGTDANNIKIQQEVNADDTINLTVYKETTHEPIYEYTEDTTITDQTTLDNKLETTDVFIKVSGTTYTQVSAGAVFEPTETYYIRTQVAPGPEVPVVLEEFSNLSLTPSDTNYINVVLNSSSEYIRSEVRNSGTVENKTLVTSGAVDSGAYAKAGNPEVDRLTFRSRYYDSTLNGGKVIISDPDVFGYFNITVTDINGESVEHFASVTLDIDDDRYVGSVINKSSSRIVVDVGENPDIILEGDTLTLMGGDDGIEGISDEDIIGNVDGTGIQSLSNSELLTFDVLIVPGRTSVSVINAALEMCQSRGDVIFVADTPFGLTSRQVVDWSNGEGSYTDHTAFNSSYGAFYWPWVQYSDTYTKKNLWLPPSGFIAAKYAYNDIIAYPWVAPAGVVRGKITNALGIEKSPTKTERDLLYGNRNIINPIANFQSDGLIIWGQKTMQRRPTALDRVNVRRLLCYLKRIVGDATRSFVFEQNNTSTWNEWKTLVNPILSSVKAAGGMYDYKISINPTAEDIENNTMPIYIYVKPTKSAEFIPITFNVMPYSASFDNE